MERLALSLFESRPIRAARERARQLLLADPTAQTNDGRRGLERALDQWVMGQIAASINNDPSRPVLFWSVDNTPRTWHGHVFPGAAVAIDNPDNVNRVAPLHGDYRYRINGRFGEPAAAQTSFNVTLAQDGQLRWGDAVATRTNLDIKADEQGVFSITLDAEPAKGRANHLQLAPGPLQLAVRDSHADWRQLPTRLTIEVVDGPVPADPPAEAALADIAAAGLQDFVEFWLGFKTSFWNQPPHNSMVGPLGRPREGGWGTQAGGRFLLQPDEALVISTRDGASAYTGFQISDPWMISPTPLHRTTSRNLSQVLANPDGSFSYVISLLDPGIANWIDTDGISDGWFMLRWQNIPEAVQTETLVERIRLVKLRELRQHLPAGCPALSLDGRREEIHRRLLQHGIRCGKALPKSIKA